MRRRSRLLWCPQLVPALAVSLLGSACLVTTPSSPTPSPTPRVDTAPLPWSEPTARGLFPVGVVTDEWEDERGKDLTIEVWYPGQTPGAEAEPANYLNGTLEGGAWRDLPADQRGPFPLIAFSHGLGGIRVQSVYLTEWLASHGFVVVAVDHPGSTFLEFTPEEIGRVIGERPGDVSAAVDRVFRHARNEHPQLARIVDPDAGYGMSGHSFGALTTLLLNGGITDYDAMAAHCEGPGRSFVCDFLDVVEPADLEQIEADPRIVTSAALSPGVWYGFGPSGEGLSEVEDILLIGGTADNDLPYESEVLPTWEAVAGPRALASLVDAGHWGFTDLCTVVALAFPECDGAEAGFMEVARAHELSATLITAWMGTRLAGDSRFAPWLEADWAEQQPDLLWQSEGLDQ